MPRVPEPLGTPKSLGGLAGRAGVELDDESEHSESPLPDIENKNLEALRERTEDWSEDIAEANIVQKAITDESLGEDTEEVESSEVEVE
jgi:hypothetical protein